MSSVSGGRSAALLSRRPGARQLSVRRRMMPFVAVAGLVGMWQAVCAAFAVPTYIVPSPLVVGRALRTNWTLLASNISPTAVEAFCGFLLGISVAVVLAVIFVHWRAAERALMPVAVFVSTLPIVAIAPVLVIMLGTGYAPKVVIAALISFFPTLINMVRGFDAVDPQVLELMQVLSATRAELFWKVRAFASLPYLFSALKIAATSSVIGAIVGEWIGSQQGLGYLIIQATYNYNTPLLYSAMIVCSLIAILAFSLVGLLERIVVRWRANPVP